jgi:uncharacterized protein Usg
MSDHYLVRQLLGWRQTTAEIVYRMPDYPSLIQTFVWQNLDLWDVDPRLTFPHLHQFCAWWNDHLDGRIVEVRVGAKAVISPAEVNHVDTEFRLH